MPHVTIETQYDLKTKKYNLAVYSGSSNNPSLDLGDPIYLQKRVSEEDVYLAKFKIRDEFVGLGDPVHFAPNCRLLGEQGFRGQSAAAETTATVERDSFLVYKENLLRCLKEELDELSPADVCTVANIVFRGVDTRVDRDVTQNEDIFILEAQPGSTMHDYARYRLNGGNTEKPKTATGPKLG
jgi:hypothetical protein